MAIDYVKRAPGRREERVVDNTSFFPVGPDPLSVSDDPLCHSLMAGFPSWLAAAREADIVDAPEARTT